MYMHHLTYIRIQVLVRLEAQVLHALWKWVVCRGALYSAADLKCAQKKKAMPI